MATKALILALASLAVLCLVDDAHAAVTHRHALHPAHRPYHSPYYHHYPYRYYPYRHYYTRPHPYAVHPHPHAHGTSYYVHVNHGAPVKEVAEEEVESQES
ncbi:uncharacterized histidine-rich protein DDB_G0274557-like [Penaeus monodon]|uniref:uncharacterized histidine-rich protein DDB_G0274557-like n=1 Tax=Penaeus monodon TaxID=6687 RepID=UPI0018A7B9EB|nr:uncharacterized histidine-rich protein DDB_G0274557-like [Penaeus monodon]